MRLLPRDWPCGSDLIGCWPNLTFRVMSKIRLIITLGFYVLTVFLRVPEMSLLERVSLFSFFFKTQDIYI